MVNGAVNATRDAHVGREGFWAHGLVTPVGGRRDDDAAKFRLTIRDVVLLLAGCLAMYGAQIGVQWGMRSDIRDLKTAFEGYQQKQNDTNGSLQRQIDETRRQANLAIVNNAETAKELSELRGYLEGAGIKRGRPK